AWTPRAAARPAEIGLRKHRRQPRAKLFFSQQSALVGIPVRCPFLKCGFDFGARQRTIFVAVGGGEQTRPGKSAGTEPAPTTGRTKSLWRGQQFAKSLRE